MSSIHGVRCSRNRIVDRGDITEFVRLVIVHRSPRSGGQFAHAAIARYRFGAGEIAAVFAECGLVMIVAQLAGASIARRVGERGLIGIGLGAMSVGFVVLVATVQLGSPRAGLR